MRKQLTEAMISKLPKPVAGRKDHYDTIVPALAVRITDKGAKSFIVRGRVKGRADAVRITVGDAKAMRLADARHEASEVLRQFRTGIDPRETRRLARVEEDRAEALQFERVVEKFIELHAKKNRGWKEVESLFKKQVTPLWRGRLLSEITRADVVELLDSVEERASVYRANRFLAAVRKLFNWSVARGYIETSPIVAGMARQGEEPRTRYLTLDEIGLVWRAAETIGQPWGPFFKFLMVTGQRRSEAANARWASFDLAGEKLWTLAAEDTKADREHLLPLSPLALELLAAQPRINDPKLKEPVWVFTAEGSLPVRGFGGAKERLDATIEAVMREKAPGQKIKPFPAWRLHDLRRTVATHMEDALGIPPHIVGSVLNHSPRGYKGVTSVYTRGALIFERRRALIAWSRLLQLIVGREGLAAWQAVAKVLQPVTEADAARTMELRRMIQGDEEAWAKYLKALQRGGNNVVPMRAAE